MKNSCDWLNSRLDAAKGKKELSKWKITLFTKVHSERNTDPNTNGLTIKFLEENIKYLHHKS